MRGYYGLQVPASKGKQIRRVWEVGTHKYLEGTANVVKVSNDSARPHDLLCSYRLKVRTPGFQPGNRGFKSPWELHEWREAALMSNGGFEATADIQIQCHYRWKAGRRILPHGTICQI